MPPSASAAPTDERKPGFREALESLRHRDFALFWWSALVSSTGSWMQNVAVPFVLFQLTGNAFWIGLAGFVQWIPGLLIGPLAGSLADRFSRRRVLLVTQTLLAAGAFTLWAIWASGLANLGTILGLVCVMGFLGGLNMPSWQAFVTELVPRERLLNAVTLNSAQFNASRALGPAIGGLVLARLGPGAAFLLNAVSFGAVIAALLSIRVPGHTAVTAARATPATPAGPADEVGTRTDDDEARAARIGVLREFAGTLRYVRARPGIVACLVLGAALGFFGMPLMSLVVVFTEQVFHVGRAAYGFLGACLGIGAIIGTPLVAGRWSTQRRGLIAGATLPIYGATVAGFALAPGYWFAVVMLVIAGAAYLGLAAALNTTVQLQVDEDMRGKAIALYLMSLTASMPIGALLQGWLVEQIGPRPVVAGAGIVLIAIAAAMQLAGRLELLDDAGLDSGPAVVVDAAPASASPTPPVPAEATVPPVSAVASPPISRELTPDPPASPTPLAHRSTCSAGDTIGNSAPPE